MKQFSVGFGVAALLALAGCADDDSGNPDVGDDVTDTGGGDVYDAPVDDATEPDEPIGPPDYPAGPYGREVGTTLDNLHFVDVDGNVLTLADLYNDHSKKLLWIYATAGWCSVCGIESRRLKPIMGTYGDQGLQILAVIFEAMSPGAPATVAYARSYANTYGWPEPKAVADEPFVLGPYFDKAATPMNMFVDLTDMEILDVQMGWDEGTMTSVVEYQLGHIADR